MGSDQENRYMIEVFRPVIRICLIPSQIMPRLTFLSEHLTSVVSKERNEGKEAAADLFLEKLLSSSEPGWYAGFIKALERNRFPFLHKLLNGYDVHDHRIYQNLLTLHLPELLRIHASNVVADLTAKGCLSEEDQSEILAVETQKGPYHGAMTLFSRVNCRDDEWFPKLMWVLKKSHKEIVEEILSTEAAEADSFQTMTRLIKTQMEHGGKLFQGEPMDMSDMVTKLHEINFEDNSGPDLCSGLPSEERPPPEGQADIANSEKELPTPMSRGQKRSSSPDNDSELNNTKKLNTTLGIPGSSILNNLNIEDKVFMDKFKVLDTTSALDGTSGMNIPECQEVGESSSGVQSQELILRAYQEELAKPAMEGENVVVFAPTGSGKTHVAVRITQHHFETADPEQEPKVLFIVPTVNLVQQQLQMFKTYLGQHNPTGISGDMELAVPIEQLIQHHQLIILTPQILVDALKNEAVSSLSVFSLLMFDECHHAMKIHPYARIQQHYLNSKLGDSQSVNLPQVVGFTASVGVGKKTRSIEGAVNHILKLCANLDIQELGTVERHKAELARFVSRPDENSKEVRGRKHDPFQITISRIMGEIEQQMKESSGLQDLREQEPEVVPLVLAQPSDRGSDSYTEWLGKLKKPFARLRDKNQVRRFFQTCAFHLGRYNSALLLNADCRTVDALDYIDKKMGPLKPRYADDTDRWLHGLFDAQKASLETDSNDARYANPKLEALKSDILSAAQETPDLRCIVFVKTREMTLAISKWMNEDGDLKQLGAKPLAGKARNTETAGMNQAQQENALQYFRDGKHKVIVATSVAEEGLDIQKCNLVITYEHVTNEIAYVQSRGRARADNARFHNISGVNSGVAERGEINQMKEETMQQAIRKIKAMSKKDFQWKVLQYQKEILLDRRRDEFRSQRRQRSDAGEDDDDDYEIRCGKCNCMACFSSDVRKIQDSHHVVTDPSFLQIIDIKPHPNPRKIDEFNMMGKVFCKECDWDWGIQVLHKGVKLPVIKISSFAVIKPDGSRGLFKKWKEVPFSVAALTTDQLLAYGEETRDADN